MIIRTSNYRKIKSYTDSLGMNLGCGNTTGGNFVDNLKHEQRLIADYYNSFDRSYRSLRVYLWEEDVEFASYSISQDKEYSLLFNANDVSKYFAKNRKITEYSQAGQFYVTPMFGISSLGLVIDEVDSDENSVDEYPYHFWYAPAFNDATAFYIEAGASTASADYNNLLIDTVHGSYDWVPNIPTSSTSDYDIILLNLNGYLNAGYFDNADYCKLAIVSFDGAVKQSIRSCSDVIRINDKIQL